MLIVKWDITEECNLQCRHCGNAGIRAGIDRSLPPQRALALIDEMGQTGVSMIEFLGGEPLVRPDIFKLVTHARKKGIRCSITTNAQLISERIATELIGSDLNTLTVSLDGASEESHDFIRGAGTFQKVTENTKRLLRLRCQMNSDMMINVNFVLMKTNYHEITKLIALISSELVGINRLVIESLEITGNATRNQVLIKPTSEEIFAASVDLAQYIANKSLSFQVWLTIAPKVQEYLDQRYNTHFLINASEYCKAACGLVYLTADGRMFPCNNPIVVDAVEKGRVPGVKYENQSVSVSDRRFQDLYNSPYLLAFFQHLQQETYQPRFKYCERCKFFQMRWCKAGCPLYTKGPSKLCLLVDNL